MPPDRAFLLQARSDLRAAVLLTRAGAEDAQVIHCLQMAVEKAAKGFEAKTGTFARRHNALSRGWAGMRLRVLSDPRLTDALGGRRAAARVLNGHRRTMLAIESLQPQNAGVGRPNCEYPWEPVSGVWRCPARHRFGRSVGPVARGRVMAFLDALLARELALPTLRATMTPLA